MRRWNRLWDVVLGVIVSLLCAFPVSAREKVILDSDMVEGFDDGVAMLALAQSPGIELIGVTIVAGNTWVSDGVAYALRQLEIAGQNIPVAAGVGRRVRIPKTGIMAKGLSGAIRQRASVAPRSPSCGGFHH